jgi:hypothetical protein
MGLRDFMKQVHEDLSSLNKIEDALEKKDKKEKKAQKA